MTAIIIALAATRLVRAWKHEPIGEAPYNAMQDWAAIPVLHGNIVNVAATRRRAWVGELFECPHCLGTWIAIALSALWPWRPARVVTVGLASAMVLSSIVDHYPRFDHDDPDGD